MIVYGRTTTFRGLVCEAHARERLQRDLTSTLFLGWWGAISIFVNGLYIVPTQIAALIRIPRLFSSASAPAIDDATESHQS